MNKIKISRVESIKKVKLLFETVYKWGKDNHNVNFKDPLFQQLIKEIKKTEYYCPANIDEAPFVGEICEICLEEV